MALHNITAIAPTQKWVASQRVLVDSQLNIRAKRFHLGHYETCSVARMHHGW
jgi:hypothetical protein